MQRSVGWRVALLGALFIGWATLRPEPPLALPDRPWCLLCSDDSGADWLQNVLLFAPLGFGLGLAGVRARHAIALATALSFGVELAQYTVVQGRSATLSDVVTNTIGGGVGWWLAARWRAWLLPAPSAARRLALAALAAWLAVAVAGGWATRPLPLAAAYARRAPLEAHGDRFHGRVLTASVAGLPITSGALADGPALRRAIARGTAPVDVRFVTGAFPRDESAIVAVVDRRDRRVLQLTQGLRDLTLSFYTGASLLRLRSPYVVLPRALPETSGDTLRATGGYASGRLSLAVPGRGAARALELGPALAWTLFYPFRYGSDRVVGLVTLLWALALLVPAGYWSAHALTARRAARAALVIGAALGVALVLGYAVAPRALGLVPARPGVWLAALLGFLLGGAAGALALTRARAVAAGPQTAASAPSPTPGRGAVPDAPSRAPDAG